VIGYAINISGGRAELKEIYRVVKRIRPATPDSSIRSDLYRGMEDGLFRRNSDGTYSQGSAIPSDIPLQAWNASGVILDGKLLSPFRSTEKSLEDAFIRNYRLVFGEDSLYIPIKKLIGQKLRKVTDGLMLDKDEKGRGRFWIVELELASHSLDSHVQVQILGFLRALKDERSMRLLVRLVNDYIRTTDTSEEDEGWADSFLEGPQKKVYPQRLDPYEYIDTVLHENCGIIIVIDKVQPELEEIVTSLSEARPVRVVEFSAFKGEGKEIFTFSHVNMRLSE
jgi:hypothetical protein